MVKKINKQVNTMAAFKAILIFASYFLYTNIISSVFAMFGVQDDVILMFISDLIFFFGIVYVYKDTLKADFISFMKNYTWGKKIWFILKWVLVLFAVNMLGGMLTELLAPELAVDDGNTTVVYTLASISTIYTVFKGMIFGVVAEELVFKKAIRDVIYDNNILFIVVSSIIYGLINIAYTNISIATLVPFCSYFLFSSVLSYVYVKNDNIVMMMLVKLFYNLIPLALMLIELGA